MSNVIMEINSGICVVTLNRPEKLNALNVESMAELKTIFKEIASNTDVKAVILTGAGDKAFVAGADIKELSSLDKQSAEKFAKEGQATFSCIENCTKAVIAAVNGFALGGGCELALSASFRIASDNAKFALPEVTLGLMPGYGGTQRLSRLIGAGRAAEMMVTGSMIDAKQALSWGLVNEVLPQGQLMNRAEELANKIADNAPLGISNALKALNTGFLYGQERGYQEEATLFAECFDSQDAKEGTMAFLEKRKAKFSGQ